MNLLWMAALVGSTQTEAIVGDVRVQFLSPTLVRLEQRGPLGFEDRITFTVVERAWKGISFTRSEANGRVLLAAQGVRVSVPAQATSLQGTRVADAAGKLVYECSGTVPGSSFLPPPSRSVPAYVMADAPRLVPPEWGAAPMPAGATTPWPETSGWDTRNDAPDIYVFLGGRSYESLRAEFLRLTGPTPLPPKYAFGFIDSRYHPYTQQEALDSIDEYRKRRIPLDVFVVDTDWRVNGSHGYEVEKKLFPDMKGFLRDARRRNVRTLFNDHPEPQTKGALDPAELEYRYRGLTGLIDQGLDGWWYDRNWSTSLVEPMPGLRKEVWGQRLYTDILARHRPGLRPFVMSNVQGIDNGYRSYAPHPASHRYPIWWTGDTVATWGFLQKGVENGVDFGVEALLPYVNEDLGGHGGTPSPELYVRFLQYGCLSPITRVHCTRGMDRHPWAYGEEAEKIVRDFVLLRYRLLPTLYTAARRSYEDGTPMLRRCDLEWPQHQEARSNRQYLLGDDILVAPIVEGDDAHLPIPAALLRTPQGAPGLQGEYYANGNLEGAPALVRTDPQLAFEWAGGSPDAKLPSDRFSARWTGTLGPIPRTGEYTIVVRCDDGVRLWLDGKLLLDKWGPIDSPGERVKVTLKQGQRLGLKLEYAEITGQAGIGLRWAPPTEKARFPTRSVWIPPGEWEDAWTGSVVSGPRRAVVQSPLWHMPIFVRRGGIVATAPEMQYSSERPWSTLTLDAYVPTSDAATQRRLYEDDGLTPDYQRGKFSDTSVSLSRRGQKAFLKIGPSVGWYQGKLSERVWVVRLHTPKGSRPSDLRVNGKTVSMGKARPGAPSASILNKSRSAKLMPFGRVGSAAPMESGPVIQVVVPNRKSLGSTEVSLRLK